LYWHKPKHQLKQQRQQFYKYTLTTVLIYKGSTTTLEPTPAPKQNENFKITYFEVVFPTLSPIVASQFLVGNIAEFRNDIRSLLSTGTNFLTTSEANQVIPVVYRQGFLNPSSRFFGVENVSQILQDLTTSTSNSWKNVSANDYFTVIFYLASVWSGGADDSRALRGADILSNILTPDQVASRISGASLFGVKYLNSSDESQFSYPESGPNDFDSDNEIAQLHKFPRTKLVSGLEAQNIIIIVCASFFGLLVMIGLGLFCCSKRIKIVDEIPKKAQNPFRLEQLERETYMRDGQAVLFTPQKRSEPSPPQVANPFSVGKSTYYSLPVENNLKGKFKRRDENAEKETMSVEAKKAKWENEEDL
jgi:hypothetical protein